MGMSVEVDVRSRTKLDSTRRISCQYFLSEMRLLGVYELMNFYVLHELMCTPLVVYVGSLPHKIEIYQLSVNYKYISGVNECV